MPDQLWWTNSRVEPVVRRVDDEHNRMATYDADNRIGDIDFEERIAPVPNADACKDLYNRKTVVVNRAALLYILNNIGGDVTVYGEKFYETVALMERTVE